MSGTTPVCSHLYVHTCLPAASPPQVAGSPIPSFVTTQCCDTVVNGCLVPYTNASAFPDLYAPLVSQLPGNPTIQWNGLTQPNSITSLSSQNVLVSGTGQYFLSVSDWGHHMGQYSYHRGGCLSLYLY